MNAFRAKSLLSIGMLFVALILPTCSTAKGDKREPALTDFQVELQSLIDNERYSHGLTIAEVGIERFPRDAYLRYGQAICLSGLHRYREAADLLEPLADHHPENHDFRLLLADCLFYAGKVDLALREWSRYYSHPLFAEKAYTRSAKALIARGQENSARALLAEADNRIPRPSEDLLRYRLDLEPSAPIGLDLARQLRAFDPKDKKGYAALEALYAAAGERTLFQEDLLPEGAGATIPLDIYSDPREYTEFGVSAGEMLVQRESPRPLLTCTASLNGSKPERMMLDTGCPMLFLSPALAEKLSIRPISSSQYRGITGGEYRESSWVLVDEIRIGPFTMRNVPAIVPSGDSDFWGSISGIVPISLFKRHALLYEPSAPSLTLFPSGTHGQTLLGEDSFRAPVLWFKGCPFVQTRIQDGEGVFLMMDTGSYTTFLSQSLSSFLTVQTPPPGTTRQTQAGLSGRFSYSTAHDVRFCFARSCTRQSTVQVARIMLQFGIPPAGLLGRDILDRYTVFLDYRTNSLLFKARRR